MPPTVGRHVHINKISTEFPKGFTVQRVGITAAIAISHLPADGLQDTFRNILKIAEALLGESYDKKFTPSSFIQQKDNGFRVGWFTRDAKHESVREISALPDAATDYLLFSLGKGRWTPQQGQ